MKLTVTDELKSRLTNAASNGSVIACDILAEIRKNVEVSEIIKGNANYFSTKRKRQSGDMFNKVKVVFTVCTKDVTNPNFPDRDNPQAPWFIENRAEVEASTFIGYFKNLSEYNELDINYFSNAICVNSKITVKVYDKMNDFVDAYTADNYSGIAQYGDSSLHSSCMRYDTTARNAADFYHNFAGAKIIIAKDSANNILGRAILWTNALLKKDEVEYKISVLDRVYFTHSFIISMIYEHAKRIGVHLRKQVNDFNSCRQFISINPFIEIGMESGVQFSDLHVYIKVPAKKWHKNGAPYLDTFYNVLLDENKQVILSNKTSGRQIAECRETSGSADRKKKICPKCGIVHYGCNELCEHCHSEIYVQTIFGEALSCKTVEYKGEIFPSLLFKKGRPVDNLQLYLQVRKLYA